eukprot:5235988-Alexandrium_andersonii.AAC.1
MNHLQQNGEVLPEWLLQSPPPLTVGLRLPKAIAVMCGLGHWQSFAVCNLRGGKYKGWHLGNFSALWPGMPIPRWRPGEVGEIADPDVAAVAADTIRAYVDS